MYVGREILNSVVKAVSQLCLEFDALYYINPVAIQRCIVDQRHIWTAELYQKYSCATREYRNTTEPRPNILPHNCGKICIGVILCQTN